MQHGAVSARENQGARGSSELASRVCVAGGGGGGAGQGEGAAAQRRWAASRAGGCWAAAPLRDI